MKIETAYLAGAMESLSDEGLGWRLEYQKELDKVLEIHAIIPGDTEQAFRGKGDDMNVLKKNNPKKYQKIMRRYMKSDFFLMLEMCDIVICRWEGEGICGTVAEVNECYMTGKPLFLVTTKPYHEIPGWFAACFDHENIFDSLTCLIGHLGELKYGTREEV